MEKVSIIIPAYNEENHITTAIESLLDTDYPRELLEILVVDGGSTDNTVRQVRQLQEKYGFIRLLNNPQKIVPVALNIGIKNATGSIIIRADAHSTYSRNYVYELVTWLEKLQAGNVGGRVINIPKKQTKQAIAIARVLESRFGVGNASFRTEDSHAPVEVDTVPFGCWKKTVFDKTGLFDERLERVQDLEMNKRLKRAGEKIYLLPWVKIFYHPRETYIKFAKNYYQNGYWNILTVYFTRTLRNLSVRHYIPLLFVLGLILPLIAALFIPKMALLTLSLLTVYLLATVLFAYKTPRKGTDIIHMMLAFFTIHFSYGLGELMALLSLPFKKR